MILGVCFCTLNVLYAKPFSNCACFQNLNFCGTSLIYRMSTVWCSLTHELGYQVKSCSGGLGYSNSGLVNCILTSHHNSAVLQTHISFDMSRTTCYITVSVTLKMELLVQITQIEWLLKFLVKFVDQQKCSSYSPSNFFLVQREIAMMKTTTRTHILWNHSRRSVAHL